jgi:hypothetical protein
LHSDTRRWEWTHRSLLCALVRRPYGYEIIFGNEMRDRLNRIGKDLRVLP